MTTIEPITNITSIGFKILPHIWEAVISRYERKASYARSNIILSLNQTISDLESLMAEHLDSNDPYFQNIKTTLNKAILLKKNIDTQDKLISTPEKNYHLQDIALAQNIRNYIFFFDKELSKYFTEAATELKFKNNLNSELESLESYLDILNKSWLLKEQENIQSVFYRLGNSETIEPNTSIYNKTITLAKKDLEPLPDLAKTYIKNLQYKLIKTPIEFIPPNIYKKPKRKQIQKQLEIDNYGLTLRPNRKFPLAISVKYVSEAKNADLNSLILRANEDLLTYKLEILLTNKFSRNLDLSKLENNEFETSSIFLLNLTNNKLVCMHNKVNEYFSTWIKRSSSSDSFASFLYNNVDAFDIKSNYLEKKFNIRGSIATDILHDLFLYKESRGGWRLLK